MMLNIKNIKLHVSMLQWCTTWEHIDLDGKDVWKVQTVGMAIHCSHIMSNERKGWRGKVNSAQELCMFLLKGQPGAHNSCLPTHSGLPASSPPGAESPATLPMPGLWLSSVSAWQPAPPTSRGWNHSSCSPQQICKGVATSSALAQLLPRSLAWMHLLKWLHISALQMKF